MHHHLEIVMPPTSDIEAAVKEIMAPFDENAERGEDDWLGQGHEFWDWWVIGGRFAGNKAMQRYDQAKLQEFYDWLNASKVTVSGVQCGKQELSPESQIPMVDAKWNEMFTPAGSDPVPCPIFAHSNDQYDSSDLLDGDVCLLKDALKAKCSHVIIACPSFDHDSKSRTGPLKAEFMLRDLSWNGVNHMPVDWDGTVGSAVEAFKKQLEHYREDYRQVSEPRDEWLTVTVDYHS